MRYGGQCSLKQNCKEKGLAMRYFLSGTAKKRPSCEIFLALIFWSALHRLCEGLENLPEILAAFEVRFLGLACI